MTWVDPNQGKNQEFSWDELGKGLLKFIQTPESMALGQGLLAGSQPNMNQPVTFGGALANGLQAFAARKDKEQEKEFEKAKLEVAKGHLNVDIQKLNLEQQKIIREMEQRKAYERSVGISDSASPIEVPQEQPAHQQPITPMAPVGTGNGLLNNQNPVQPMPVQGGGGLLGGMGDQQMPAAPMPPPQMPTMPQAPIQQAAPQQSLPQSNGEEMVRLNNGMTVTRGQAILAQAYGRLGEPAKGLDVLAKGIDLTTPELIKITREIYGTTDSPEAKAFMHDVKLKPQNQTTVNLGETESVAKIKAKSAREDKIIGSAMEGQAGGRTTRKLAIESYDLIKKLREAGFDPFRFDLTKQLEREKIKSALGRGASEEVLTNYELLNKNITKMQVESMGDISAKGLNQYFEKQLASSLGSPKEVQALTTQKLMVGAQQESVEKEFRGAFLQAYQNKYGNLDNAEEAFNTWMDTAPGVKYATGKNIEFESDRKIASDMKKWIAEPGSEEYIKARLDYLGKKDAKDATDEELEFFREHGE